MPTSARVLIVGAGTMGKAHAAAARSCGSIVAAVVDTDQGRRETLARRYGAQAFATLPEALQGADRPDTAVVASPSHAHLAQSRDLLEAGISVLVEKPHRLPGQDPGPLRQALRGTRARYHVGMSTRYSPGLAAIARAVHAGMLGRIEYCSDAIWYTLRPGSLSPWYFARAQSGGGVLLTNGVHALDRAAWLVGGGLRVRAARLTGPSAAGGCETAAELMLDGPSDNVVHVSLLWTDVPVPPSRLVVAGERGSAVLEGDGSYQLDAGSTHLRGGRSRPQTALVRQWRAFIAADPGTAPETGLGPAPRAGPGLDDLEPTLALIEQVYGIRRDGPAGQVLYLDGGRTLD
jgi:predicted dehydrogenase